MAGTASSLLDGGEMAGGGSGAAVGGEVRWRALATPAVIDSGVLEEQLTTLWLL